MTRFPRRAMRRSLLAGASLCLAPPVMAQQEGSWFDGFSQTTGISVGGTYRLHDIDPRLVGAGNGGSGNSINSDDGERNFHKGLVNFGAMGRTRISYERGNVEGRLQLNYVYDFLLHDGKTDGERLPDETVSRIGKGGYLGEAWLGYRQAGELPFKLRLGNQVLQWGESRSAENQINLVNPLMLWRAWLPGGTQDDVSRAIPMLWGQIGADEGYRAEAFYQTVFRPSEPNPRGSFFSGNDYYSPGSEALYLAGNVPDNDQSVKTPATPFGSRIPREDVDAGHPGQFGLALRSPKLFGELRAEFGFYAAKFVSRELNLSSRLGLFTDLTGQTSANYAAGSRYLVSYADDNKLLGVSAKFWPSASTQVRLDASTRFNASLQVDDQSMIEAGMAPAAIVASCANPASAVCAATVAHFNANPVVRSRGGITPASAASWFGTDISGVVRKDLSQVTVGLTQGLPNVFGSRLWVVNAEWNGQFIHGYDPAVMPIDTPAPINGQLSNGIATKVAAAYKIATRIDFADLGVFERISVFAQYQDEYRGRSPFPRNLYAEGRRWFSTGFNAQFARQWSAQALYRAQLNHNDAADFEGDRPFVNLSVTRKF